MKRENIYKAFIDEVSGLMKTGAVTGSISSSIGMSGKINNVGKNVMSLGKGNKAITEPKLKVGKTTPSPIKGLAD